MIYDYEFGSKIKTLFPSYFNKLNKDYYFNFGPRYLNKGDWRDKSISSLFDGEIMTNEHDTAVCKC